MKKFISFVMAGAMVASLVPATAFAKGEVTATAKVVDAWEKTKDFNGDITGSDVPELQLKVTSVDYQQTSNELPKAKIKVTIDGAEFIKDSSGSVDKTTLEKGITVSNTETGSTVNKFNYTKVALQSETAALEAILEAYYNNGKDLSKTYVVDATEAAVVDGAVAAPSKSTAEFKLANATLPSMYTTSPADQKDAALDVFLGTSGATFADYSFVADSAAYGKNVWIKNMGATGAGPAVFAQADFLSNAGKSNMSDFTGVKDTFANWKSGALTALQTAIGTDNGLYTESKTTVVSGVAAGNLPAGAIKITEAYKDEVTIEIEGYLTKDTVISFNLLSVMDKVSEGKKATVSVDSKLVTADDLAYVSILGRGLKASVRKTVDVAAEEKVLLTDSGLKIESAVGDFNNSQEITLKISKGFEFVKGATVTADNIAGSSPVAPKATVTRTDDNELTVKLASNANTDELTLKGIEIEATSAKSGTVATITVKSSNNDSATVEVAKVVDYKVSLTVDADEDVPVIYSGVNVANYGITDDSDHYSLEVTAEETFPGAWSMRQGFNFNLPDGVYVTGVKVVDTDDFYITKSNVAQKEASKEDWVAAFEDAYQDGDHKNFEFGKRVFDDVNVDLRKDPATVTFQLELVADPTFEGDVKLTFEGALVDKQEATIAKFVKPYTVKAEQNDVIIDYRNTSIKTPIVVTEAEEGLWAKDEATFTLNIEDDLLTFEDDATFTVDSDSELELKNKDTKGGTVTFTVKAESDKAASVTLSDLELYMQRNVPAGGYDLEIKTSLNDAYNREVLFAADSDVTKLDEKWTSGKRPSESDVKKDSYVDDVADYSEVAKEAFVNVVTSGRDNDNLFTTKVVVPVGEAYIVAGENQVALDVPAYISAAGYTMLPIRAVSKALGVDTNNVLWSAETRTITIMYAQRIITMTVGQKTVYVNGSAIPASAAPEIKDGRAFLPLRDLGTALGVTNVTWDAATKTATLN